MSARKGSVRRGAFRSEKKQHEVLIRSLLTPTPTAAACWVCFTDGACIGNPGPTGAAAVLVDGNLNGGGCEVARLAETLRGRLTNNVGELHAVNLALTLLERQQRTDPRVIWHIFTDSQYVLGMLEKKWTARANIEQIKQLRARLGTLSKQWQVTIRLHWVRSHVGIRWNELADKLSVAAAKQTKEDDAKMDDDGWRGAKRRRLV